MRKNSVRKFIHAILDLLPLLIIPIFAININQKSVEPIQVEVQEKISVLLQDKFIGTYRTFNFSGVNVVGSENSQILNGTYNGTDNNTIDLIVDSYLVNPVIQGHKYVIYTPAFDSTKIGSTGLFGPTNITGYILFNGYSPVVTALQSGNTYVYGRLTNIKTGTEFNNWEYYVNFFDLSEMFGLGNEPTIEEFITMFPVQNYSNVDKKMLVNKTTTTTYDETDIGSQFLYSLYIPVHDYFNFNNLFNMGTIYDWIQLNLFSGTAPLPVFIIWNIIVYEFFVDLIFLLYGVFMFIIDFAEKCLERPFRR